MAASRLLHTPDMRAPAMLSGQTHATLARSRPQAVGWLGHDAPWLHDGTTPPQAGLGTVKSTPRAAYRLQPPVAFPPARGPGGVLGLQVWPRPEPPVAPPRNRKPLAEQERDRGLEG
jgi:hypothetical protein